MATAFKKLINSADHCVEDSLEGFVAVHSGLQLIEGHQVVVRGDLELLKKQGKVTLLSGGGSGHEPAHVGYIGKGMLTAVVAGRVFTSPPPASILVALRILGYNSPAGTLVIVKNYTGDRLNFGIAVERAKAEGLPVEMILVGEDCALTGPDKTAGRRGLCGTVFIHKIAGAMAEDGKSLNEILKVVKEAAGNMGTLGVSLTSCSVPGKNPSFELGSDEMELGLGIHGEIGVKRVKVSDAARTAEIMINHMTSATSNTRLELKKGDKVALMVNNLGGTTNLELFIMAREFIKILEQRGVIIERTYCSTFMTALEMAGVSVTILHLDETRKKYLDSEANAPGWTYVVKGNVLHTSLTPLQSVQFAQESPLDLDSIPQLSAEDSAILIEALRTACQTLIASEQKLNELDKLCGNGNFGTNMEKGAQGILTFLDHCDLKISSRPYLLFQKISAIPEEKMGGSSGALYTLFLSAASRSFQKRVDFNAWMEAFEAGIGAIVKYGGAEPGDRTMLDPLHDALIQVKSGLNKDLSHSKILEMAVVAAEKKSEATAGMKAHAGRASYVSAELLSQPDAGATGVALWMRAVFNVINEA